MSDHLRDPPRWLASKTLDPALRRDLLAYGSAAPSGERRARMLAQLEDELGSPDGAGSVGGLFSSSSMKLSLAAGALVIGSLALLALLWPSPAQKEQQVRSPVIVAPGSGSELREPSVRQVPVVSASAPSAARSASPAQAASQAGRSAKRRSKRVATLSEQPSDRELTTATQPTGALAELTLLARARRALLVQPERSLALAEQHARSYPSGTFREEREVLAIESLAKLSRIVEAKERVRLFEKEFPSSTHRAHLTHLVAGE